MITHRWLVHRLQTSERRPVPWSYVTGKAPESGRASTSSPFPTDADTGQLFFTGESRGPLIRWDYATLAYSVAGGRTRRGPHFGVPDPAGIVAPAKPDPSKL